MIRGASGKRVPISTAFFSQHTSGPSTNICRGLPNTSLRHSSAFFVQGVPHTPAGSTWEREKERYVGRLLALAERYAPDLSSLVVDVNALTPPEIESHFGITHGNIDHVDNAVAFADRVPYRVGVDGVYAGAAGCHPAGSVIGCAGHNAAHAILTDLERLAAT